MELEALLIAMESLPANPSVAMRVLWLADGSITDAAALAHCIESDPGLSARVLRLANSAYYSPGGTVSSISRGVINVGFATVKSLAAATLSGLDDAPELPDQFWSHAAQVAHASSMVARHFGAPARDTFSVGLLHDVGEGLLCCVDPLTWRSIESSTATASPERLAAEMDAFTITHAEVAARVLEAWRLPAELHLTIGEHHLPVTDRELTPVAKALHAGESIAELYCDRPEPRRRATLQAELQASGLPEDFVERIGSRLARETRVLVEALSA